MDNPIKTYNENGNVEHECYYKNGNIHKIDGPSYIGYHANGDVRSEFWTYDNKSHRLCGPDHITYYVTVMLKMNDGMLTERKY